MEEFRFLGDVYSPFKFLDAYDREDKDLFFGRDKEIEFLYETTFKTDLILFYGQSGTGKTSLIRCGLANKLKESEWLEITIRRGDNINASLWKEIDRYLGTPVELETPIADAIESLYTDFLRPVYLIFDQFEELFILGSKTEQEEFFKKVSSLLQPGANCKLIFVMREEYIARLHNFEKLVPGLFRNRVRIEPMYMTEVEKVIRGSAAAFGIQLDKDKPDETVQQIMENISDKEAGIQLPYLQVYLDRLYKEAVNTTAQFEKSPGGKNGKTRFTLQLVRDTGPIGDVLGEFLNQQTLRIQGALTDRYPGAPLDTVWQVLNRFVTPEGTRMAMPKEKVYSTLQLEFNLIDLCLEGLEKSRILRPGDKGQTFELAHDTLAQRIDQNRSAEEKAISKCERLVITKFKTVSKDRKPLLLTGEELKIIAPYEKKLRLEDEEKKFIEKSKEKASRRKKQITLGVSAVILIILLAAFSFLQWKQAEFERFRTFRIKESLRLISEARDVVGKDPTLALRLAEASKKIWWGDIGRRIIYKIYSENSFYKVLVKLDDSFNSSAFSPGGEFILTTHNNDGTVRLWYPEGKPLRFKVSKEANQWILCGAVSPNSQYIVIGLSDGSVRLWNLADKQEINFKCHQASVQSVTFSPDGQQILTGSFDRTARLWDLRGQLITKFSGHEDYIRSTAFSPDGQSVLTGSDDATARLWDLGGNEEKRFVGHGDAVHSVAFSSFDDIILTGSDDGTARLWDREGSEINSFKGYGRIRLVTFLPDSRYILICSTDIHLLDTAGNQLLVLKGHKGLIQSLVFLVDPLTIPTILTSSADQTIRSWQLNQCEQKALPGHEAAVYCAAYSPDGNYILTGSWDKTAILWDAKGNQLKTLRGHTGVVHSIAFSPDSQYILTGAWDSTARLWDLQGNQINILSGHKGQVRSAAFSADGQYILTGTYYTVRLWDRNGDPVREISAGRKTWFTSAAFSPKGEYIITGSGDRTARLWNLGGDQIQNFVGPDGEVTAVTFSPDGKTILIGSSDKTVRRWDLKGNILKVYKGYTSDIQSLAFSPDGKFILAACENIASLRDLDGNEFQVFNGCRSKVFSAAFSPGGQYVVTATADKTARLWNVKRPLEDFLKTGDFQQLSAAHKQKYGIED